MAIFKRNEPQPARPRERSASTPRSGSGDGAISIIGQGMTVVGDVSTDGVVRVEGVVQGTIRAGKAVILGQGGHVEGNIYTNDAVLGGSVAGSIVATNRLELQGTCVVDGEISTRAEHLKLEEGARFSGQVVILDPESAEAAADAAPSPAGSGTYEWGPPETEDFSGNSPEEMAPEAGFDAETGVSPRDESFR